MIGQYKPHLENNDFKYIKDIIQDGQISQGKYVDKLQKEVCRILKVKYANATSSGTTALHLALLSLNIAEGDEVIIPSYTCTALLNAIYYVKATPVLVDIDSDTFNITYNLIRKKISKKTKAIIVTHSFGFPADMDEILKSGIPVIEDCAHALGSSYKEKPIGSLGTVSILSMYATKMISAGEGGMVLTKDKKIANRISDLNSYDRRDLFRLRYNYKMSDLTAGLALSQLRKLDFFVQCRTVTAKQYQKAFSQLPIKFQLKLKNTTPNYFRFIISTSKADEILNFSHSYSVFCDKPIYKPLHQYLNIMNDCNYFNTESVWKTAVSVPIYPSLKNSEISKIIDIINKAFEYYRK